MTKLEKYINLRKKILGVLIYDARTASRRTIKECASAIGVSFRRFQSYENGQLAPSLPEIEALSYFLKIPIDHFWSAHSISENQIPDIPVVEEAARGKKDRIIGKIIRKKRNDFNITLKHMADELSISEKQLRKYELGYAAIPLPDLEIIISKLDIHLEDLFDQNDLFGTWRINQSNAEQFLQFPQDLQEFIINARNTPYLEIAQHLSQLPADKLREVAEGLLEITL